MEDKSCVNKKVLNYSIRLLAMKDYSIHKIREKLKSRSFSTEEIDPVINKLIECNYIREEAYTKTRIRQFLLKGFNNNIIIMKLSHEHLNADDSFINEIRDENQINEEDQISKLIEKKLRFKEIPSENDEKLKLKNKIISFLSSKGHCPSEVAIKLEDYNL